MKSQLIGNETMVNANIEKMINTNLAHMKLLSDEMKKVRHDLKTLKWELQKNTFHEELDRSMDRPTQKEMEKIKTLLDRIERNAPLEKLRDDHFN